MKFFIALLLISIAFGLTAKSEDLNSKGFKDNSEFGEAIVSGNANSETYNVKQINSYAWESDLIKLGGHYLEARTSGALIALNWDATLRYERTLSSLFSSYVAYSADSDIFAGYVQRNNSDIGGKYFLSKDDDFQWSAELGYRYSAIHYPSSQTDISTNSVRIYTEATKIITQTTTLKFWVEYVPTIYSAQDGYGNYHANQDYLINAEPSISVMMNKILSLKSAYLFKYKNYLPTGSTATKYLDTFFTTSLVAQF